ncbi:transcriptional regulator [Enterovibrio norvegicus FF-162]|uniref:DNA-binding transcriptional regulator NagC n=1 Tax=Enterovibrio norvegicus TaxID=188144 RepID=UPI0002E37072|nr:ROK family protein [Enterovibrio norvegicus]OEE87523.1 transcriptional regulator [Enterovibrio norvegicus FF-162]
MTGGQIGNVDLVKQLNGAAVYRLIDQQGPISRIQIADVSSLAPASVTKITRQLLERGLIKEVAQQASTGGRRAISLTTECAPFHSLAVRLGRDRIELTLFDLSGKPLAEHDEAFHYPNQETLIEGLLFHLHSFLASQQDVVKELIAVAISLPGLVDAETGIVEYMPHITIDKLPLSDLIRDEFGVQCYIGNDTRGQALAEHYFGVSKNYYDTLLVSVHNGAGAGIIVNGQVFLGYNRNVGEIGHIQIDPLGKKCQCGNFGCLETVASNPAIIEHAQQLLAQGHESMLQGKKDLNVSDICRAAVAGDELARQVLVKVGNHLGKAIAMTINLFNPQQVVISGEITEAKSVVFPAIQRCVENQSLRAFHQNLPVVAASLSSTTPTLGAFALVKRAMLNGILLQKLLED